MITLQCDDFLEFHIRAVGPWTNGLLELVNDINTHNEAVSALKGGVTMHRAGTETRLSLPSAWLTPRPWPSVLIDGPCGAPTQQFYDFDVVVLVGAGIGFTPMASVMRQLIAEYEKPNHKIIKAYSVWTSRDQNEFSWFTDVMSDIAAQDSHHFISVHNYLTSVKQRKRDGFGDALLHAAREIAAEAGLPCAITGLQTRTTTKYGRPDFDEFFGRVHDDSLRIITGAPVTPPPVRVSKAGAKVPSSAIAAPLGATFCRPGASSVRVGVFFCGPHRMATAVESSCLKASKISDMVSFQFFSENF